MLCSIVEFDMCIMSKLRLIRLFVMNDMIDSMIV